MSQPSATPASQPGPPQPVSIAVKLMWAGAALTVLGVVLGLTQTEGVREELSSQQLPPGTTLDAAVTYAIAAAIVVGVITAALWVLLAIMNRRGKPWARVVATVLGVVNVLVNLYAILEEAGGRPSISLVSGVVSLLLAAVVIFLLWRPESSRWYEAMRSPAPAGA